MITQTYRIVEATDSTEYNALSDTNKGRYALIISAGLVDLMDGTAIRSTLWSMFGDGTTTRDNIIALDVDDDIMAKLEVYELDNYLICTMCQGTGEVVPSHPLIDPPPSTITCPSCSGSGKHLSGSSAEKD
jgi:hypothetical protein